MVTSAPLLSASRLVNRPPFLPHWTGAAYPGRGRGRPAALEIFVVWFARLASSEAVRFVAGSSETVTLGLRRLLLQCAFTHGRHGIPLYGAGKLCSGFEDVICGFQATNADTGIYEPTVRF